MGRAQRERERAERGKGLKGRGMVGALEEWTGHPMRGAMGLFHSLSDEVAAIVERAGPAVLHVRALRGGRSGIAGGSGVLISPDGLALTNSHVVHGASGIEAELSDG